MQNVNHQFEKELLREIAKEEYENERLTYLNEECTPREIREEFKKMRGNKNWSSLVIKMSFMDNVSNELTKNDIQRALELVGNIQDNYSELFKEYCDDIIDGRNIDYIMLAVKNCFLQYKLDVQTYNNLIGLRDAIDSSNEDHEVKTPKLVVDELFFEKMLYEQSKKNSCENKNVQKIISECVVLFV